MGGGRAPNGQHRSHTPQPPTPTPLNRATVLRRTRVRSMSTFPHAHQLHAPGAATHAASPPNNPEQSRTNLNAARCSDQMGAPPESAPDRSNKTAPNGVACAWRPTPLLTSPLEGGRDELGSLPAEMRGRNGKCAPTRSCISGAAIHVASPPNNPEQSRTNPNAARCPDQMGVLPESAPDRLNKTAPNSVACAWRPPPLLGPVHTTWRGSRRSGRGG